MIGLDKSLMCKKLGYLGGGSVVFFGVCSEMTAGSHCGTQVVQAFQGIFSQKRFVCYHGIPMKLVVLTPIPLVK